MEHDAEPSTLVGDHISHLAALTAQRNGEMLDVSLAQGVLELLPAPAWGSIGSWGRMTVHSAGCAVVWPGAGS